MKYKVTSSFVMSGRLDGDSDFDFESSRFGFYWFYFMPSISHNKGSFKKGECVDIGICWLCFIVGLTFWPNRKGNNNA